MDSLLKGHLNCPTCQKEYPVKELTPAAAQLLRARYDKLRPTLSAVEQTIEDARDKMTPEDGLRMLDAIVERDPHVLQLLNARYARKLQAGLSAVESTAPIAPQQESGRAA